MGIGKLLILVGLAMIIFGIFYSIIGKLPGDIVIEKQNFKFFFPIASSIIISIILTLLINLWLNRYIKF